MDTGSESTQQGQAETALVWLFRFVVLRVAAQAGALPTGDSLRLARLRARPPDDAWISELDAIGRAWVSAWQWAPLAQPGALFDPSLAPEELPEPAGVAHHVLRLDAGIAPAELHSPRAFGALYERLLVGRRSWGAFYTPAAIVEQILADALAPFVDQIARQGTPASRQQALLALRVCDPAAGTGAFLVAAAECLVAAICRAQAGTADVHAIRRQVLENCVYGVELDALGTAIAQVCLCLPLIQAGRALPVLNRRVVAGNALTGRIGAVAGQAHPLAHWQAAFPDASHGFDLVLGNPPYIDSERMTSEQPQLRRFCAATWETARGNWDMFVVFVELGLRLTRPGGRCAMIVPNRLLDAPYAAQARRMLRSVELEALVNYSRTAPFQAGVYPVVFVARNAPAPPGALLAVREAGTQQVAHVDQTLLDRLTAGWSALFSDDVAFVQHCLAHGATLAGLADVDEAATVAEAYALAPLVGEALVGRESAAFRLVNTGTIDPYQALWGVRPARYLGAIYRAPVVEQGALVASLPRLAIRARQPKLVLAGLVRRLEVCLDAEGMLLPAKSTVVVAGPQANLWYLLGLLNSAPASRLYRAMFGGLALSGGYVRIGAPQLRQLPVPHVHCALAPAERAQRLAHALALFEGGKDAEVLADATASRAIPDLACDLLAALARQRASAFGQAQRLDTLIDALALWLYEC